MDGLRTVKISLGDRGNGQMQGALPDSTVGNIDSILTLLSSELGPEPLLVFVVAVIWGIKLNMPLKFMLRGIMDFGLGGASGLLQADHLINWFMHNTQWVSGFHIHQMLLTGLSSILFAAIYALLPMLTGTGLKSERLSDLHLWLRTIGGVGIVFSMGLAGRDGMLRSALYSGVELYLIYMNGALFFCLLLAVALVAFLLNIIQTYGLRTVIGLFNPFIAKTK
jgi:heme/copper-type cytochrome/quinol oxidase subunit 1